MVDAAAAQLHGPAVKPEARLRVDLNGAHAKGDIRPVAAVGPLQAHGVKIGVVHVPQTHVFNRHAVRALGHDASLRVDNAGFYRPVHAHVQLGRAARHARGDKDLPGVEPVLGAYKQPRPAVQPAARIPAGGGLAALGYNG